LGIFGLSWSRRGPWGPHFFSYCFLESPPKNTPIRTLPLVILNFFKVLKWNFRLSSENACFSCFYADSGPQVSVFQQLNWFLLFQWSKPVFESFTKFFKTNDNHRKPKKAPENTKMLVFVKYPHSGPGCQAKYCFLNFFINFFEFPMKNYTRWHSRRKDLSKWLISGGC